MEFLILLPPSLPHPSDCSFSSLPHLIKCQLHLSFSCRNLTDILDSSLSHIPYLIHTNEHESMSFIYLKNKCNHNLLPSTVATLSKQPPSPALVLLAVFFLVSLLLLFSQHSSQDDSLKWKSSYLIPMFNTLQ